MLMDLDKGFDASQNFRAALAWYAVVIILRLFKAFSSQPRLALVSKTLAACMVDVFHFSVVFFSIFFMYSVAGYTIFGHRLPGFASLGSSVRTTVFIVMGDYDWEHLEQVGRTYAFLWLSTFFMIISLLMLNMLLAIVFDTYSEVKGSIGSHAETLWSQTYEIYRRTRERKKGRRVGLPYIQECLLKQYGGTDTALLAMEKVGQITDYVKYPDLMAMIPGFKEKQAHRLGGNAWKFSAGVSSLDLDEIECESEDAVEMSESPNIQESSILVSEKAATAGTNGGEILAVQAALLARQDTLERNVMQRLETLEESLRAFAAAQRRPVDLPDVTPLRAEVHEPRESKFFC